MVPSQDGGFFVFGDLSVKMEGEFRLLFSLFEMAKYARSLVRSWRGEEVGETERERERGTDEVDGVGRTNVVHIKSVLSDPFTGR